jgi:cytochrome c-type biogenesis protein CcmH
MSSSRDAASLLAPVAALCLLATVLPAALPSPKTGPSSDTCLTLADSPPGAGPESLLRLERCSVLAPNDVQLLADLGAAYEAADTPAKAEAAYRRALALDPDAADVRLRLGTLALVRGDAGEARRQAEAALRVQPNRRALVDLLRAADAASTLAQR